MFKQGMGIDGLKISHVQGIATDRERKRMYYSCTDFLAKTDMDGNIIGTVKGLIGHLGCIAYNYDDGMVYGSLEFKHDSIGKNILENIKKHTGEEKEIQDGFYIVRFNVDKITRLDMDAEKDGVMQAVFLGEVFNDYKEDGHRYGCSGIDGTTFAPLPGEKEGKNYLYVSYGIYGDVTREDNDHQVILRYDLAELEKYFSPLEQKDMHRKGPKKPGSKYFVYTGNTTYGIQNLEYCREENCIFCAVYKGKKPSFPNYFMYVIDLNEKSKTDQLKRLGEVGERLFLSKNLGIKDEKTQIRGIDFPYGSTGMISLGDNYFYFSEDFKNENGFGTKIGLYKFNGVTFERVK